MELNFALVHSKKKTKHKKVKESKNELMQVTEICNKNKYYSLNKTGYFRNQLSFSLQPSQQISTRPFPNNYLCRYYHLIKTQPRHREKVWNDRAG